ncbi:MAG: hypothetical protein ACHQ3P_05470 [Candidatus Limnocylindrales bacterium]
MSGTEHDRTATRLPWPIGPAEPRSIVSLIGDGTIDPSLASLLWLLIEARVPLVVAAGPQGSGKTTLLFALLDLLPPAVRLRVLAGYAEDFDWLPEAATLGWRPHGFTGIAAASSWGRAASLPEQAGGGPVDPATTCLLVPEFSEHIPLYTWGEQARIAVRAISLGYDLGATIHAESLEEVFELLGGPEVGLTDDELSRLGVVLILRVVRAPSDGRPVRRVVAAHYVRPVARDAAGHVQRLGPAVLATWDGRADRFEDFAWGVVPELAERVGRKAGDFETERDRRAGYLAELVRAGLYGRDEVAAAIAHWGHAGR